MQLVARRIWLTSPGFWLVRTTNCPTDSNEWGQAHLAPSVRILWNHMVPVIYELEVLTGGINMFKSLGAEPGVGRFSSKA